MKKNSSSTARKIIIDKYYSEVYSEYCSRDSLISLANEFLEKKIERNSDKRDDHVLEIGGGGGDI